MTVQELINQVQSSDESARQKAMEAAKTAGPEAVVPLARAMQSGQVEVVRTATRSLWNLVHAEGAPGGAHPRETGEKLLGLLGSDQPTAVRREALWMVSEICETRAAVRPVAALLENPELKEDARLVLERLPGKAAVNALQAGFVSADDDFKFALAASLRKRGVAVEGYPSQKLLPIRMKSRG
jgi:HEAT repeat protein